MVTRRSHGSAVGLDEVVNEIDHAKPTSMMVNTG